MCLAIPSCFGNHYDPETQTYTFQSAHLDAVPRDIPLEAVNIRLAVNDIDTIHAEDFINNTECESLRLHVNRSQDQCHCHLKEGIVWHQPSQTFFVLTRIDNGRNVCWH